MTKPLKTVEKKNVLQSYNGNQTRAAGVKARNPNH